MLQFDAPYLEALDIEQEEANRNWQGGASNEAAAVQDVCAHTRKHTPGLQFPSRALFSQLVYPYPECSDLEVRSNSNSYCFNSSVILGLGFRIRRSARLEGVLGSC